MEGNELNNLINEYKQKMSKVYNMYLSNIESSINNRMKNSSETNYQKTSISDLNLETNPTVEETSRINSNESELNNARNNLDTINYNAQDSESVNNANNSNFTAANTELEINENKDLRSVINPTMNESSSSQALYTGKTSTADESYIEFLNNNYKNGDLKVQVTAARQAIPISDVSLVISKDFNDGKKIFYNAKTDESGIVDNLLLPAPPRELSMNPTKALPFATYNIIASHPGYQQSNFLNVPIFEGIKSIQYINLLPLQ